MSPKGKMPWITYNGEDVSDSQFCIEYLSKKLDKDLSSSLTSLEKATARAIFKMCDYSLFYCMNLDVYVYGPSSENDLPWYLKSYYRRIAKQRATVQGYGTHTKEESKEKRKLCFFLDGVYF